MKITEYVNALPDSYKKSESSNNYKLLSIEQRSVKSLTDDIEAIRNALDIRKATGKTLDHYGRTYSQARGSMTDEQYRYVILQKVAQCLSGCDCNSVIQALASIFGVDATEFKIIEGDCFVEIDDLPYSVLQSAGLTSKQLYELICGIITVGVTLKPLDLEGTFEFDAASNVYNESAGFGDIEQTIGGYFGLLENGDISIPN